MTAADDGGGMRLGHWIDRLKHLFPISAKEAKPAPEFRSGGCGEFVAR